MPTASCTKKWPLRSGAIDDPISSGRVDREIRSQRQDPIFQGSETEIGQVAIAHGDAAAGGQQSIDRGHQAAEQGAGGREADRCSLGHKRPLFLVAEPFRFIISGAIYVYQMPETTGLFA